MKEEEPGALRIAVTLVGDFTRVPPPLSSVEVNDNDDDHERNDDTMQLIIASSLSK